MRERRLPFFGALAAGAAVLVAFLTALPASAATVVATSHQCTATALGVTQTVTQNLNVDVTAPASAASGSHFTVVLAPEPATVPTMAGQFTIVRIQNLQLKVTVTNATVNSATLSGGSSNLGTTGVTFSGGLITATASGPIAGGASFTLNTLTLDLTAGTAGSPAKTSLVGTNDRNTTDLIFVTVVRSGPFTINANTNCVPNPNPTGLSSTSVT
jgi:dehydratase